MPLPLLKSFSVRAGLQIGIQWNQTNLGLILIEFTFQNCNFLFHPYGRRTKKLVDLSHTAYKISSFHVTYQN